MTTKDAVATADVIIAYSDADASLVASIAERAAALGIDVRLSPQPDEKPDDARRQELETQLDAAGALLICWSERAVASHALREWATLASARGKLAACRVTACAIPFPFDAVATADLQNWGGRIDQPQWAKLVAALAEILRRPGLPQLLGARVAGDEDALDAVARRFPEEPEARRIWNEREAKYRLECAAILTDARRHFEQRVTSEQSKIENALTTFARDFDAWLERERRGEASAKPNLNTLFELWLERGGRKAEAKNGAGNGGPPSSDEGLRRSLAAAEEKANALQQRLAAEIGKVEDLQHRLQAAASSERSGTRAEGPFRISAPPSESMTLLAVAKPKPRRRLLRGFAALLLLAAGAGAAAEWAHRSGREPQQLRDAREWLFSTLATIETQSRIVVADALEAAGDKALDELLRVDKEKTIARAVAFDPQIALARVREIEAAQAATVPARPTPNEFLATSSAQERTELVAAVVKSSPSDVLAQLLASRRDETIDELLRSERATLLSRLGERAQPQAAVVIAPVASPPVDATAAALARLTQLPPRDIARTLTANVSPQNLAELGKLLATAAPQKIASYRVYDNRDIVSDDVSKLRNYDQDACVAACRKKEACKAYTYDKWNRVCYLKSSIGDFRLNPRSSSGVREDVRIPRAPSGEVTMERYPSKAFPGSGYKTVKADGAEDCEDRCRDEDACVAFTFRLDEGACHLFKTTGEYFSNQLADSGGKRQE